MFWTRQSPNLLLINSSVPQAPHSVFFCKHLDMPYLSSFLSVAQPCLGRAKFISNATATETQPHNSAQSPLGRISV